jgi:hypothetical protein
MMTDQGRGNIRNRHDQHYFAGLMDIFIAW